MSTKIISAIVGALVSAFGVVGAAVVHYLARGKSVRQRLASDLRDDLAEDREFWRQRAERMADRVERMELEIERLETSVATQAQQIERLETYIDEHPEVGDSASDVLSDDG